MSGTKYLGLVLPYVVTRLSIVKSLLIRLGRVRRCRTIFPRRTFLVPNIGRLVRVTTVLTVGPVRVKQLGVEESLVERVEEMHPRLVS